MWSVSFLQVWIEEMKIKLNLSFVQLQQQQQQQQQQSRQLLRVTDTALIRRQDTSRILFSNYVPATSMLELYTWYGRISLNDLFCGK